eukprot:2121305-Rhodomonas_salina.5
MPGTDLYTRVDMGQGGLGPSISTSSPRRGLCRLRSGLLPLPDVDHPSLTPSRPHALPSSRPHAIPLPGTPPHTPTPL